MSDFLDKLCPREQLAARVAALPRPIVFTNGVFDILHRGHVSYLAQARALGASLVIGLNSDASARGLGKRFGAVVAAQDLNVDIGQGERVGGRNRADMGDEPAAAGGRLRHRHRGLRRGCLHPAGAEEPSRDDRERETRASFAHHRSSRWCVVELLDTPASSLGKQRGARSWRRAGCVIVQPLVDGRMGVAACK